MVLDIALARYDNTTPFGFKMVGGADFDVPLQVVKILPGSIAEEVGMQIGDVVVRINDIPTSNLSYYDAHQLLACAGNRFVLGILRAREIPPQQRAVVKERTPLGPVGEVEYINRTPKPFWGTGDHSTAATSTITAAASEEQEIEEKIPDVPITDEQIAEILSGEAEVLKQHNVIGVNFNKMIPKAEVFKQSEVFKTLNSELVQQGDDEGGDKKWTTFMQKPTRPPPKSREEREREAYPPSERYQVRIVKQPKPKIAPDYKPPKSPEPEPEPEPVPFYDEYLNERTEAEVETIKTLESEPVMVDPAAAGNEEEGGSPAAESSEDETSEEFREQLQNVQKQLEALSSLPNTIQLTIAALTEQLAALAQPKRKSKSVTPRPAEGTAAEVVVETEIVPEVAETFEVTAFTKTEDDQGAGEQSTGSSDEGEHIEYTEEQLEKLQQRMKEHDIEWTDRNDKTSEESSQAGGGTFVQQSGDTRTAVQNELKMQVVKKKKKAVSAFGPLVPAERPIYLPGGRKWRNAKDAFNEQFIAEVISSQAELIQGTTLGNYYESPHLGYDESTLSRTLLIAHIVKFWNYRFSEDREKKPAVYRVNFLKYQKPEKDLSFIKNSDVYKLIHDQDAPKCGIELRPEMVLAEEDVRKCASPC